MTCFFLFTGFVAGSICVFLSPMFASVARRGGIFAPTIAALLDSQQRPKWWTRDFTRIELDHDTLGLVHTELEYGQADAPPSVDRRTIYDTTLPGYGNGGHTFGDALTAEERRRLIAIARSSISRGLRAGAAAPVDLRALTPASREIRASSTTSTSARRRAARACRRCSSG